jgi:hypothetical protein
VAEAMIVIVRWVLMAARSGVRPRHRRRAARGIGAVGVLAHYVAIVSLAIAGSVLIALAIGIVWGRVAPVAS